MTMTGEDFLLLFLEQNESTEVSSHYVTIQIGARNEYAAKLEICRIAIRSLRGRPVF